jgi:hypothetical protein
MNGPKATEETWIETACIGRAECKLQRLVPYVVDSTLPISLHPVNLPILAVCFFQNP